MNIQCLLKRKKNQTIIWKEFGNNNEYTDIKNMDRLNFLSDNKTLKVYDINLMDHNRCFFCSYKNLPTTWDCSRCIYVGLVGKMSWRNYYSEKSLVRRPGSKFKLKCPQVDDSDRRKVCRYWYFNNKLLKANQRGIVKMFRNRVRIRRNRLFMRRISSDLTGRFTCKVVDQIERVQSVRVFKLQIRKTVQKPVFIYVSKNITARPGDNVKLEINVISLLHPLVSWFHNPKSDNYEKDKPFKINDITDIHPTYHIIKNITEKDAGVYVITASNYHGMSVAKIYVDVLEPKIMSSQFKAWKNGSSRSKNISKLWFLSFLSTVCININVRAFIITFAENVFCRNCFTPSVLLFLIKQ